MIVDSSALVAILKNEPERGDMLDAVATAASIGVSAATYLETGVVIDGERNPAFSRKLDQLLVHLDAEIVGVDEAQARVARQAYRDFGKGSGHKAKLNFGDCFAYALASVTDESLLYKGDDFGHTDIRSALD